MEFNGFSKELNKIDTDDAFNSLHPVAPVKQLCQLFEFKIINKD